MEVAKVSEGIGAVAELPGDVHECRAVDGLLLRRLGGSPELGVSTGWPPSCVSRVSRGEFGVQALGPVGVASLLSHLREEAFCIAVGQLKSVQELSLLLGIGLCARQQAYPGSPDRETRGLPIGCR